jgi:hypothetical protein
VHYHTQHQESVSVCFFFFFFFFKDKVSLCSPGCPGTHDVDQADLELRDPLSLSLKFWN